MALERGYGGRQVKVFRAALVAVVMLDLALLGVALQHRETFRRYALAGKQRDLRALVLEQRTLLSRVAEARRPERVAARAASFGIDLRAVDRDRIDRPAEAPAVPRKAVVRAPRPQ